MASSSSSSMTTSSSSEVVIGGGGVNPFSSRDRENFPQWSPLFSRSSVTTPSSVKVHHMFVCVTHFLFLSFFFLSYSLSIYISNILSLSVSHRRSSSGQSIKCQNW